MQVRPGKLARDQAWVGAVVAASFLVFGVTFAFFVLGDGDHSEGGMQVLIAMFFVIWTVACGSMLIFFVRVGSNRRDNSIAELSPGDLDQPSKSHTEDEG